MPNEKKKNEQTKKKKKTPWGGGWNEGVGVGELGGQKVGQARSSAGRFRQKRRRARRLRPQPPGRAFSQVSGQPDPEGEAW